MNNIQTYLDNFLTEKEQKMKIAENIIGIDNLLNLILVIENVRPAYLFQPIDYKESSADGEKSKHILNQIKEVFPELKHYDTYQGVLISKKELNIDKNTIISSDEMGRILGYPCWDGFSKIDSTKETTYGVRIIVIQTIKPFIYKETELISNICKDFSQFSNAYNNFIDRCEFVFARTPYNYLNIKNVVIHVEKYPSLDSILNKLASNIPLDNNDKDKISNIFYNACLNNLSSFHFEPDNPTHRGILLGILLNEKNSLLTPFMPFKPDSLKYAEICEISKNLEKDIIDMLHKSKIH
jgi:hypothetical protein